MNSIGEALSEHLRELEESMGVPKKDNKDTCKESWRQILKEQERSLMTLAETTESYRLTTIRILKQLD